MRTRNLLAISLLTLAACGGGNTPNDGGRDGSVIPPDDVMLQPLPAAVCNAATGGGSAATQAPMLQRTLTDSAGESWLASPAVVDLDRDGSNEVVIARAGRLVVYGANGQPRWNASVSGRIWASPVIGNFAGDANLEVVVAARAAIHMYNAAGQEMPGFPVMWRDEVRSLAAGDVDADGRPEIVAVTTSPLNANNQRDIIMVFRGDGSMQQGYPPNTTGTAGCTDSCYVTGGYDQNIAVGPIDADNAWDVFAAQDNAYLSWHRGNGVAFDAASIFRRRNKVLGVRFLHNYAEAQQGYADNEPTANQAHFTNSAPAIADIDGDGRNELVILGSVQNASQDDRFRGVGLWVINSDGTRPQTWVEPFHAPQYLAGLWDFDGTNIVGATNQVSLADMDPAVPGLDMVFAGFDGRIHLVGADRRERWTYQYTTANNVLTGGVVLADLSGDGVPEVVFNTYSTAMDQSALYILNASGALQHRIALPRRGSMSVPTVGDVDGNGTLEIVVNLKDNDGMMGVAQIYTVPGSSTNCMPWPTGRANDLRNGFFRVAPRM